MIFLSSNDGKYKNFVNIDSSYFNVAHIYFKTLFCFSLRLFHLFYKFKFQIQFKKNFFFSL